MQLASRIGVGLEDAGCGGRSCTEFESLGRNITVLSGIFRISPMGHGCHLKSERVVKHAASKWVATLYAAHSDVNVIMIVIWVWRMPEGGV